MKSTTFALALVLAALPNGGCSGRVETASAVIQDSLSAVHGELSQAGLAACDHYYAAQYTRCGGPILPASENARLLIRFEQVCENEAALPGSGVTAASLEACASALDASPCELPEGPPVACNFSGSLPGGSDCTDGLQCQSGACSGTVSYSPGGPTAPFTCGTCAPAAVVGQACNSAGCQATAVCITADTSAAQPNYACVAVEQGAVGAACDGIGSICKPGLYCPEQTRTCEKLAVLGAPCGDLGDPGGVRCAARVWPFLHLCQRPRRCALRRRYGVRSWSRLRSRWFRVEGVHAYHVGRPRRILHRRRTLPRGVLVRLRHLSSGRPRWSVLHGSLHLRHFRGVFPGDLYAFGCRNL